MIDHLRISGLGVIGEATVDLDPGFTVVTGAVSYTHLTLPTILLV